MFLDLVQVHFAVKSQIISKLHLDKKSDQNFKLLVYKGNNPIIILTLEERIGDFFLGGIFSGKGHFFQGTFVTITCLGRPVILTQNIILYGIKLNACFYFGASHFQRSSSKITTVILLIVIRAFKQYQ